jgi:hypothetical protein
MAAQSMHACMASRYTVQTPLLAVVSNSPSLFLRLTSCLSLSDLRPVSPVNQPYSQASSSPSFFLSLSFSRRLRMLPMA